MGFWLKEIGLTEKDLLDSICKACVIFGARCWSWIKIADNFRYLTIFLYNARTADIIAIT
jgi:hypothetical protein